MKTEGMSQQLEALRRMDGKRWYALFMEQGTGKAQPVFADVMTPFGWRPIGDLRKGDAVFAANGDTACVLEVYPQGEKPVFEVTFNDGTKTWCCDEHLWMHSDPSSRMAQYKGKSESQWKIGALSTFRSQLRNENGECRIAIPLAAPVEFLKEPLPIDPYILGVLLGDGCLRRGISLSSADSEIVEAVRRELPFGASFTRNGAYDYAIVRAKVWRSALIVMGLNDLLSHEKFIPDSYKFNARSARIAMLQGLLDTDGTVENGTAIFGTSSSRLADDVLDIARSLGAIARLSVKPAGTYTRSDGTLGPRRTGYTVRLNFSAASNIVPFRLSRKAALYRPHTKYAAKRKFITSVESVGKAPCICIAIDHPTHLYITDGFNVTHNTWSFLSDAERAYEAGKIDALIVFAPNGVHTNWVLREIPMHLGCDHIAKAWRSGMGKAARRELDELIRPRGERGPLRIFAINYEALRGEDAFKFTYRFMRESRCIAVADESQKIKNLRALVTQQLFKLKPLALARRIGTGTPMDKPGDIFAQMEWLEDGLLGTSSYRAFVTEYAVVADARLTTPPPEGERHHRAPMDSDYALAKQIEKHPRMKHALIIAKDETTGLPMYRNLDRLQRVIEPHSYRVLKQDCMDLPPKVYQSVYFDLTPKQRAAYDLMENELRIQLENGELEPVAALASLIKLQQITSGFVVVPGREELLYVDEKNPRIEMIAEHVEDVQGKVIVWARFREEIAALARAFAKMDIRAVQYHGDVKNTVKRGETHSERDKVIDEFQEGNAQVFLGVQKAGGTGLTLTAAQQSIYCSNEFSAIMRLQSEDRNHRKGSVGEHILYTDVVAINTIDESIVKTHQFKTALAAQILGDRRLDVRRVL